MIDIFQNKEEERKTNDSHEEDLSSALAQIWPEA